MPRTSIRRTALAVTAASLITIAPLVGAQAAHAAVYPPVPVGFGINTSIVIAGGRITFTATLFTGQTIFLQLSLPTGTPFPGLRASRGTGRTQLVERLGTYTADAQGHVSGEVTIPANTTPGVHLLTLTAKGSKQVWSTPITVSRPGSVAHDTAIAAVNTNYKKPLTPSASSSRMTEAAEAAGLVAVGGAAVAAIRRRRRTSEDQD
jgi:hypothetical protein